MSSYKFATSESVSEGHPDKVADQISDAILDALIEQDPHSRVACETLVKSGIVLLAGEITTTGYADLEIIARNTIREIGYDEGSLGFDGNTCAVLSSISKQSPDIARGVDTHSNKDLGAGDQGLMFGYASNETDVLMPAPIVFAHRLVQKQSEVRKSKKLKWLRPDAKSQISLVYENNKPVFVHSVILSTQHSPDINHDTLVEAVMEEIIKPVLPKQWLTKETRFLINPTGRFVLGGPVADCGLTGRKIIVDSYGGAAHHGGGCFSGKDPTKVDRSAAYAARYVAKNIVAAGLADRCEVQICYAIGVSEPININVETFGTHKIEESRIVQLIKEFFDLTPGGIIESLKLLRPIYKKTAAYGHFGRELPEFTWEFKDKVDVLKSAVSKKSNSIA